jgi:hypothetical protein
VVFYRSFDRCYGLGEDDAMAGGGRRSGVGVIDGGGFRE